MIRLIKMELYRLIHTVSGYVMIFVTLATVGLTTFAVRVDMQMMKDAQKMQESRQVERGAKQEAEDGSRTGEEVPAESFAGGFADGFMRQGEGEPEFEIGISTSVDDSWMSRSGDIDAGGMLMSQLNSCLLVVLIAIFVPLFVNAEQKKGYIKNIAGQIPRREMLAFSKMPAVAVQVFVLFVVFCAANLGCAALFFHGWVNFTNLGALFGTLCIQYIMHSAWGCLIALFTMATRSTAFAMTTGILLVSGVFELALRYLNRAVQALIPSADSFDAVQITLSYATGNVTMQSTAGETGRFVVTAVVYIAISAVVSGVIYHKRDVR